MILAVRDNLTEIEKTPKGQHTLAWEMLYGILAEYTDEELIGPSSFFRGVHGKPFWKDHPETDFSISHCKEAVAVAVSLSGAGPAGVDVERRFSWKQALAERIAHPDELPMLLAIEDPQAREDALNCLWSIKESYMKYTGEGLWADPHSLNLWRPCRFPHTSGQVQTSPDLISASSGRKTVSSELALIPVTAGPDAEGCVFLAAQNERYTLVLCADAKNTEVTIL